MPVEEPATASAALSSSVNNSRRVSLPNDAETVSDKSQKSQHDRMSANSKDVADSLEVLSLYMPVEEPATASAALSSSVNNSRRVSLPNDAETVSDKSQNAQHDRMSAQSKDVADS